MAEEMESKEDAVRDVIAMSSAFLSCPHRRRSARKPAFVDWYLILGIEEDVGVDVIRRRYRQLALRLHPDKSKHPKAEVAFKLVSEAYECLSDKGRRKAFDSERWNSYCEVCYERIKPRKHENREREKCHRMVQALKEVQNRLKEENRVIESCLRTKKECRRESPLFDPSDRQQFPGYPHRRTWVVGKSPDCWQVCNGEFNNNYWSSRGVGCESPVYKIVSDSRTSRSSTPGFRY